MLSAFLLVFSTNQTLSSSRNTLTHPQSTIYKFSSWIRVTYKIYCTQYSCRVFFKNFSLHYCLLGTVSPTVFFLKMDAAKVHSYIPLHYVLQNCYNSHLKLKRKDTKKIFAAVERKIGEVIDAMKSIDDGFADMYSRIQPTGSFFDKLKIRFPDEFDLNVIVKLPNEINSCLQVEAANSPRFVQLNAINVLNLMNNHFYSRKSFQTVRCWIDSKGYFCEDLVRQWFESVITKAIYSRQDLFQEVKIRKAGPAFTLSINFSGTKVDVDMVFALEFPPSVIPPVYSHWNMAQYPWFVITKSVGNANRMWQMSFPIHEKNILAKKQNLKLVCKLIKAMKENSQHMKIASYAIKTLFLWKDKNMTGYQFWNLNLGYLFVEMLSELSSAMRSGNLPYFWDTRRNLIMNYSVEHRVQVANYIDSQIKSINLKMGDTASLTSLINSLLVKTSF